MVFYSTIIIIVRWADLSDFFVDFRRKNVCFCSTSNENCHFSSEKNDYTPKRVVDFPRERDTFRNTIMEIVEDFACESNFFVFLSFFIIFLHFFFFSFFSFFHFFIFFIFSHIFSFISFFHFFHFLFFPFFFNFSFFFIFFHFLSFSFIFFHFLSISFIFFVFVGCSKSDFFWASISLRFLLTVLM